MKHWHEFDNDDIDYDIFDNVSKSANYGNKEDWEIENEEFLKYLDEAFPGWSGGL